MTKSYVLASRNAHKLQELRKILSLRLSDGFELIADDGPEPIENGVSFAENALIKARAAAVRTGLVALADDSGIAVDILGGSPGIFSARWAGPARNDKDNLELLLWQMHDVADMHRGAQFICAAAAVKHLGGNNFQEITVSAAWPGKILRKPSGNDGFGYDPIFQPAGFTVSAAELAPEVKNAHSHRFQAFSELAKKLEQI